MSAAKLPVGFEKLERFVDEWALPTERERMMARIQGDMAEITDFYKTTTEFITPLLTYMEAFPPKLEALSGADKNLAMLGLSYMECSRIFEMWGKQDVHCDNFPPERLGFAPLGKPC